MEKRKCMEWETQIKQQGGKRHTEKTDADGERRKEERGKHSKNKKMCIGQKFHSMNISSQDAIQPEKVHLGCDIYDF